MTGTFNIKGNIYINSGATLQFNAATAATITLNGTANQTIGGAGGTSVSSTEAFTINNSNNVTLQRSFVIGSTLTLTAGQFQIGANTLQLNGAVSVGSGSLIGGTTSRIVLTGAAATLPSSLTDLQYLGVATASGATLGGNLTVKDTLNLNNGALTIGANTLSLNGIFIQSSGTLTGGSTSNLTIGDLGSAPTTSIPTVTLNNLTINRANGASLGGNVTVNGALTLTSGNITLGANNLTLAGSLSGGGSSSYVATNSTGYLVRNSVGASDVLYPIGLSSEYAPVTINNAGTSDNYSARVSSTIDHAPADPTKIVNLQWTLLEAAAGSGNLTVTPQWNVSDEAGSFIRAGTVHEGIWNGSYDHASATVSGSGPYTAARSGITTDLSGGNQFVIGNDGAFVTATPTISISGALSAFGNQVVSTNSSEQTYTVSGANLTAGIVVTAPSHFQIDTTGGTGFVTSLTLPQTGGTVPPTTVRARFSPTTTGAKSGNITHTSAGATQQDQAVSGNGIKAEPTLQASGVGFSLVGADTMTVSWTRGDGDSVIVTARATSDLTADPVDATDYAASAAYAGGTAIGGGYVMYKGTGTSVKFTGLGAGTTYYVRVYEYNSDGANAENYMMSPATGNATTGIVPFVWNQTGTADWTVGTNWTPTRSSPSSTDVLQFSGGGTVTVTNVPAQTIAQLQLSNSSTVNLQAGAASNVLTIGGSSGTDLDVPSGSVLNINGTNALTILLGAGATGSISGGMAFSGAAQKINATDASGLSFDSGSLLVQGANCSGNIFTNAGTANAVVFASGSTFEFHTGSNPFALTAPSSKVVFQTGSLYKHKTNGAPSLSGRTYANFEYDTTAALSTTGAGGLKCDNLVVTSGTFNVNNNIDSIRGNISVAGGATLTFNPATAGHLNLTGTSQQNITNGGTLTFGSLCAPVLNNANGLVLNSDVTFADTLFLTNGELAIGAHTLTLNGQLSRTSGTLTGGATSNIIVGGSGGTITLPGLEVNDFTTNRGSDTVAINGGTLTVNGTLTLSNGILTPRAATELAIMNPIAITSGSYVPDSMSYLTIAGTASGITIPASCAALNVLTVNNPNGVILGGDLYLCYSSWLYLYDCAIDLNGHALSYSSAGSWLGYYGSAAQTVSAAEWPAANGPTGVYVLNPAGVTLGFDRTLASGLSLDAVLDATGHTVTLESGASFDAFMGYLIGTVRRYAPVDARDAVSLIYHVGTAEGYSPITVAFDTVTTPGYLSCKASFDGGGYPSAADSLSASKRWWTLARSGGLNFDTCSVTLNYLDGDFNTNFTLAAEDTMVAGCRYDDGTKKIWWDFFPLTRDAANNAVTLSRIPPSRFGTAGADFLFGAGYHVIAGNSWIGVNNDDKTRSPALPLVFALSKPYPNPASGRATFALALPDARHVRLDVYNMLGQSIANVADRSFDAGRHQLTWDLKDARGRAVSGGVYFYRLVAGDRTTTGRITVLR